MDSELQQSTVRSVGIRRKFHLPCKQTAGRALIHLTLRADPWPTHIFTYVSGLYLSNDFLSRGNDNFGTSFHIVHKNILSTLKLWPSEEPIQLGQVSKDTRWLELCDSSPLVFSNSVVQGSFTPFWQICQQEV